MVINLLDWKFWLFLIIGIVIVRWLYVRAKLKNGSSNRVEARKGSGHEDLSYLEAEAPPAEEISILPSWVAAPVFEEEVVPPSAEPSPSSASGEDIIELEPYEPDLLNNGSSSIGEHLTSEAFKVITNNTPIIRNARPRWLTNPRTGYPLELDIYSPSLGCGVEYNGLQHYQYPNIFNKSQEEFDQQVERDLEKRRLADQHGVPIFTVPCTVDAVVFDEASQSYVHVRRTRQQRYELIHAYLERQLAPFLASKGL